MISKSVRSFQLRVHSLKQCFALGFYYVKAALKTKVDPARDVLETFGHHAPAVAVPPVNLGPLPSWNRSITMNSIGRPNGFGANRSH